MKIPSTIAAFILVVIIFFSCTISNNSLINISNFNDSIRQKHVPDKRVAIYEVAIENANNTLILSGETNQPSVLNILLKKLSNETIDFKNEVTILPNSSVGNLKFGVINNSVANIRSNSKHSAELVTQSILGTELNVLKAEDDFYLIQTPDSYIGWVDHGGLTLMDEQEYSNWKTAKKIIFTNTVGTIFQDKDLSIVLSDVVLGAQLKVLDELQNSYKVEFPDKRVGFVEKDASKMYVDWIQALEPSAELIENYARNLLGTPYLWGGTSSKGLDCSGFVKTIYLMNGFVIPRDASQQILAGKTVDENLKFEGLKKGDLMFFGTKATATKKQRVTHVGIWLGNDKMEFIHESQRVKLNSMNRTSENYEQSLEERYLGSKRYLGVQDSLIIDLKLVNESIKL
ncbi:C40 family peptidase [uncultured Lutibacter sp.]|uniref:C40 family peptidase n=1 Tax=uncultured Lutibacter sp. TaxID=437739 RepID=UPI00261D162C|nr:C40 family peptidase [uncultured Lutibacter sp.]